MLSASQKFCFLLAAFLAAGNALALPSGCSAEKLSIDAGLLEPFSRVDRSQACSASTQAPLNSVNNAEGAATNLCVRTYQELHELSQSLKQQLASTGADIAQQKIECSKAPAECKSFYTETITRLKQAQAAQTRAQAAIQKLFELGKKLAEANAAPDASGRGAGGSMFARYQAYRAQLAANLTAAPNLEAAKLQTTGTHPTVSAAAIGARNLGDAWFKLTGAAFTKPTPIGGFGKLYQELRSAAAMAKGVQTYATCKAAEQNDKAQQTSQMIAKLETAQKQLGAPQSAALVQKGQAGQSTITGKTAHDASPAQPSSSVGSSLDGASKMLQQASGMAGQLMKAQQAQNGSGAGAASALPNSGAAPAASSSSRTASAPTSTAQATSYSFFGDTVSAAGNTSEGAATTGSSQVGSAIPASTAAISRSNAGASPATTATGSSGSGSTGNGGTTSLAAFGSTSGGASVSTGESGSAMPAGGTGASAMNSESSAVAGQQAGAQGFGGRSSGTGGSFGGGSSGGGSAASESGAMSPSAMKALDAQFAAATGGAGAKFDLAPLPALAELPALDSPATSSTPSMAGAVPVALGEQIPGTAPAEANSSAPAEHTPGETQVSLPHSAPLAKRASTNGHATDTFSSRPFLGSDNVSLFQRIHSTHERALRMRLHPVAAAL